MYIDGHLDLAFNAVVHDRDLTQDVMTVRRTEDRTHQELLVTLPELKKGGIGIVFGTLFAMPQSVLSAAGDTLAPWKAALSYTTPDEAHALAVEQLEQYEQWEEAGHLRILTTQETLSEHVAAWADGDRTPGMVILMEGADPIRTPSELGWWVERGVRLIGPAWKRTRYAGGTDAPGPLTSEGHALLRAMIEHGIPLDVSHLSTESFWDAMDLGPEHVIASHSNARAITPGDRHLSDAMIEAIADANGIIGLVLGNPFVHPNPDSTRVTLRHVRRHAEHMADLVGWEHLAIGSDFDGGFGVQETPHGITRGSDFKKLGSIAPPHAREGLLGGNWLRFLRRILPTQRISSVSNHSKTNIQ